MAHLERSTGNFWSIPLPFLVKCVYSVDANADDAGMLNFIMKHFAMYEEYDGMGRCFARNVRDRAAIFVARLFFLFSTSS